MGMGCGEAEIRLKVQPQSDMSEILGSSVLESGAASVEHEHGLKPESPQQHCIQISMKP